MLHYLSLKIINLFSPYLLFGLGLFCFSSLSFAKKQQSPLSLEKVELLLQPQNFLTEVKKSVPTLKAAEEKIQVMSFELQQAQGEFDYKIKAKTQNHFLDKKNYSLRQLNFDRQTSFFGTQYSVGFRQGHGELKSHEIYPLTPSKGTLYTSVSIPLLRNFMIDSFRFERSQSQINLDKEKFLYQQKFLEIINKGFFKLWKFYSAYEKYRVYLSLLKFAKNRQDFFKRRIKAGDEQALALVDNERTIYQRTSDLAFAKNDLWDSFLDVGLYLNLHQDSFDQESLFNWENLKVEYFYLALSFDEKLMTVDETEFDKIPQFQIFFHNKRLLEQEVLYYSNQRLPQLNLVAETSQSFGNKQSRDYKVGIQFEFPLENNKAEGGYLKSKSKLNIWNFEFDWVKQSWKREFNFLKVSMTQNREAIFNLNKQVSNTEQLRKAELKRLEQGASDIFTLNIREQDEAQARLKYIEAVFIQNLLWVDYQTLMATYL